MTIGMRGGMRGGMTGTLARFEGRRLLRNPIVWAAVLVATGLRLYDGWGWLPDLTIDTITATIYATIVVGVVLVVVNVVTSRDGRHLMPETLAALPGTAATRTGAALVPGLLLGILACAAVLAAELLPLTLRGPAAGRFDPWEVLGGVALGALGAALGAALGRWTPALIAAPVAVVVLGLSVFVSSQQPWTVLVITRHDPAWTARPSLAHLIYLVGLTAACAGGALLRHGVRPARVLVFALAIAVAVPAALVAVARTPTLAPRQAQICQRAEGVTFCAQPGYESWIPVWAEAVRPMVEAMPTRARAALGPVRQFGGRWEALRNGEPNTWLRWSRDPGRNQAHLVGQLAAAAVRLDGSGVGQARAAVALWLAGQVVSLDSAAVIKIDIGAGAFSIRGNLGGLPYGEREQACAKRLLGDAGARARIWARWDTLIDPRTPVSALCP
jgi:hypothetical protein